ncbi:MAG: hypothetical protein ACKOWF_17095 [Chloroflexota bacterium]
MTDAIRCAECGAVQQPSDRYCSQCGAAMPATAGTVAAVPEPARSWFTATRASSMLGSALILLIGALLLMAIGQIDHTGTIVIISLLVLEAAAAMALLGIVRGVAGMVTRG